LNQNNKPHRIHFQIMPIPHLPDPSDLPWSANDERVFKLDWDGRLAPPEIVPEGCQRVLEVIRFHANWAIKTREVASFLRTRGSKDDAKRVATALEKLIERLLSNASANTGLLGYLRSMNVNDLGVMVVWENPQYEATFLFDGTVVVETEYHSVSRVTVRKTVPLDEFEKTVKQIEQIGDEIQTANCKIKIVDLNATDSKQ
jgi:hypothetical protein